MQFSENRTPDNIIDDLAKANPNNLLLNAQFYCIIKVLAAVAKLELEELNEDLARAMFNERQNTINAIKTYKDNILRGHSVSRGRPNKKPEGLRYFDRAKKAIDHLQNVDEFPLWLRIPLLTEVKSRQASLSFYCQEYSESEKIFTGAEIELSSLMKSEIWPFEGIYDKEVTLKGFHLATFLLNSIREGFELDRFRSILDTKFDQVTTRQVESALKQGSSHSTEYVTPLGQWLRNRITSGKLSTEGIPYSVDGELVVCDRYEYFTSCSKYMAKRAFLDLYLYSATGDNEFLCAGKKRYNMSMNGMVEGSANRNSTYYYIDRDALKNYCNKESFRVPELQISVGRCLFYKMLFDKVSGSNVKLSQDLDMLHKAYKKDVSETNKGSPILDTLLTGIRNATEIGLGKESTDLINDLPDQLREDLQS